MQKRIRHSDITAAVDQLNKARGLAYPSLGYVQYADIRGDGAAFRPGLYVQINDAGGVSAAHELRGKTMRETLERIKLAAQFHKQAGWTLIINAIHERGGRQAVALAEMSRRGLWLSAEQKAQAGLLN